jgi:hypothetical protein
MPRFKLLVAYVFGVAALAAGLARAEYDSGGAPANASQVQANRPQPPKQIEWVDLGKLVFAQDGIIIRVQPAVFVPSRLKPAPAKKPLPKPPANPRTAVPY